MHRVYASLVPRPDPLARRRVWHNFLYYAELAYHMISDQSYINIINWSKNAVGEPPNSYMHVQLAHQKKSDSVRYNYVSAASVITYSNALAYGFSGASFDCCLT